MARTIKPKADKVYVCFESFGTSDPMGGCARGTRLRGDSPKVRKWPQFFLEDGADDTDIHSARAELYAEAGAPPPD
jgi:hypothetical protein